MRPWWAFAMAVREWMSWVARGGSLDIRTPMAGHALGDWLATKPSLPPPATTVRFVMAAPLSQPLLCAQWA